MSRDTSAQIIALTVAGKDLKFSYATLEIYESIFSHFMTGVISILDTESLTDELPILGGETVVVSFRAHSSTGTGTYTKVFKVTSITDVTSTDSGVERRMYRLHITTFQAFENFNTRISRTYKEKKEHEIVQDIATNILAIGNINVESCKYKMTVTIPNLLPTETIDEMCKTAMRTETEAGNFLFFENMDEFRFVSFDKLLTEGPIGTLVNKIRGRGNEPVETFDEYQIQEYKITKSFDWMENAHKGLWARRFIGIDTYQKKYEFKDYVYSSHFGKLEKIDGDNEKLTPFTKDFPEQKLNIGPYLPEPKSGRKYDTEYANEYRHLYPSLHMLLQNYRMEVKLTGNSEMKVGKKVKVDLPQFKYPEGNQQSRSKEQILDKKISDHWIIVGVRHVFNSSEHVTYLDLCKPHVKADS